MNELSDGTMYMYVTQSSSIVRPIRPGNQSPDEGETGGGYTGSMPETDGGPGGREPLRELGRLSSYWEPRALSSPCPIFSSLPSKSPNLYRLTRRSSKPDVETPGVRLVGRNLPARIKKP